MDLNWFQLSPIPNNVMSGTYNPLLVLLSYVIAVLASYVALDLVGRLREETKAQAKFYWLLGGAFAMGAGIWSMHFIGMLAFVMPMPMEYSLSWTGSSLLVAILASGFALYILRNKTQKLMYLIAGGVFIGLGIATMHYMGMEGMTNYVNIHYLPSLFFASIVIAIVASEAALWFALQSNQGSVKRQFYFKIIGALIMGIAICGMHYTGMAAAVFTPLESMPKSTEIIPPNLLAIFIAGITGLIISLALTASSYYKRMVNAVQNEKEFLNVMLDNLEDGIIACDSHGKITVFNNTIQKNLNLPPFDFERSRLTDYFDLYLLESDIPLKHEEMPLHRALNGEVIEGLECIVKFKNKATRQVVINGQAITNARGDKLGAVITIHDVTDVKKSEKMKSEFVSVVSHELRTPLTSIRGSLGLMLGGTVGTFPDKANKLLDIANKNCERLLLLINDILDMEKIQVGRMKFDLKVLEVNQLVEEAVITNKAYGDKFDVKLELSKLDRKIDIFVDPDRLSQVLANLISNAVKFSPKGRVVNVKIEEQNRKIRVSVSDQGAGIPIEFQSRIFQKFSQADSSDAREKGGTGLGLSISKAIIEKLGGNLNFKSKPNEGAIFYFDLPIYQEKEKIQPVKIEYINSDMKLLICEDDEDQAKYLNTLLKTVGLHSDIALSASEAKKLLANNDYYALILDLILPDQDGITLIRALRKSEKTRNLPIIVLSMITQDGREILNGDAFLVVDWLDKPVNFNKLLESIISIKQQIKEKLPHVLHVEDDIDMQHVMRTLLEKEARVTSTSTIKETIQKLGNNIFDLVILDLMLPDGNGSELLPIFSKYKLPIIVYSAFDLDFELAVYVKQVLVKSKITEAELLNIIKKSLKEPIKGAEYAK